MRNTLYLFALVFFVGIACEPSTEASEETTTEETTTMEEEATTDEAEETTAAEASTPSGEGYSTEILKGDIPSPKKKMTAKIGDADISIVYGSPSVRGRTIWGDLEPYDEVWRTGANEATTIEFSKDVMIEGQNLAAGKYALFTIPKEGDWTIIFNSNPDQFGDYNYKEEEDVLRAEVNPSMLSESVEQMEFVLEGDKIVLRWDKIAVPFTVAI